MSKIHNAFAKGKAFIPFLTVGDPDAQTTVALILAMAEAGADLIEIGIPFSDPMAEGPVIQEANIRALNAKTTTETVFSIVEEVRKQSQIPLIFLTYLNPVLSYGKDRFFARCQALGVDGILVPDLPFEERDELLEETKRYGVDLIYMVAPTSDDRIAHIAKEATGFLYVVSSLGVTGVRSEITTDVGSMVKKIRAVSDVPTAIGFGISTPKQAQDMAKVSDGAIVGSAIVRMIGEKGKDAIADVASYVCTMKDAIR